MFEQLVRWSCENRLLVTIATVLFMVGAALALTGTSIDVFPDLSAPTVTVLTESPGMAPEEIETRLTFPIETALNGVSGVRRIRSSSSLGLSVVWIEFQWGTDIYRARQLVNEKLQLAAQRLPEQATSPILAPVSSIMGEIMLVALKSDELSPMELRTLADWTVRPRLLAISGISHVVPIGGRVKQFQVLVSPLELQRYRVTLPEVSEALEDANINFAGGFYDESGTEYIVRGTGRFHDLSEIADVAVAHRNGVPVTIRDLGRVVIGPQPTRGDASVNAEPAVVLSIQKQPQGDTLALTERIDAELDALAEVLPASVTIDREIFRQADFISVAVENVREALRDGAILVFLLLLFFLGNFRSTFIACLAIPVSLLVTVLVVYAAGMSVNTMTLGGMTIAVGLLVDDAIIMVENIFRRMRENQDAEVQRSLLEVVVAASREVRGSIMYATLIIILVFVPLFFLSGVEGRMFRPLGIAFVISIAASLLVSVTVTPALCSYLFPLGQFLSKARETRLVALLKRLYNPVLSVCIRRPATILGASVMALIAAVAVVPYLGTTFLPPFNEGALIVSVQTMPGTALRESNVIGHWAEEILLEMPEVVSTARRTGRSELDEHAMGVNTSEMEIRLAEDIPDMTAFKDRVRDAMSVLPGAVVSIGAPISHRIDHMLSGTEAAIAVKIFGPDLDELRRIGKQIEETMQGVEGVADLFVEQQVKVPQVHVDVDRRAAAHFGASTADISNTVEIGLQGRTVTQIIDGQEWHDVFLRFDEPYRGDIGMVERSYVAAGEGAAVPLYAVAQVQRDHGPNSISRENLQRKLVVQANISGRDLGSVIADVQRAVGEQVTLGEDYFVVYGGQFESQQRATRLIGTLTLLCLLGIGLLLHMAFHSARSAFLVLVNLPLALIGGVLSVWLSGGVLSIGSLIGFITVFGIATRNGIMLLFHYEHLQRHEGKTFDEAIVQGSLERLSPILMTALGSALALVPLALAAHEPGNEIQSPLAIVILGGLLTSTALNLIVMPALYRTFGKPVEIAK